MESRARREGPIFQRLLVPIDGFQTLEEHVIVALRLAAESRAAIVFCRVVAPASAPALPAPGGRAANAPITVEQQRAWCTGNDALASATRLANDLGLTASSVVVAGEPTDGIVAQAIDQRADLIITGRRRSSRGRRSTDASVSEALVRRAACPVLVVNVARDPAA